MGILTLPNKNLCFFRSCQCKNKKNTKEFNKILIQIFCILVCYIFRSSDKVKPLEKITTLKMTKGKTPC